MGKICNPLDSLLHIYCVLCFVARLEKRNKTFDERTRPVESTSLYVKIFDHGSCDRYSRFSA